MIYQQGNIENITITASHSLFFLLKPNQIYPLFQSHNNETLCINPFKIQLTENLWKVVKYSIIAATCLPLQSTMSICVETESQSLLGLKHSTHSFQMD